MSYFNMYNRNKVFNLAVTTSLAFGVLIPSNASAEEAIKKSDSVLSNDTKQVSDSKNDKVDINKDFVSKYTVDFFDSTKDNYVFDSTVTSVSFTLPLGVSYRLYSNDNEVPFDRIGKTEVNKSKKTTSISYFGVPLEVGKNEVRLIEFDGTGKPTTEHIRTVYVRGGVDSIEIEKITIPADAMSVGKISITLKDKFGNPADDRGFITVRSDKGIIRSEDKDPNSLGIQIKSENGKAQLLLASTNQVDTAMIEVEGNSIKKTEYIDFTTPYREPILVGIAKTNSNYKFLSGTPIKGDINNSGFNYGFGGSIFAQGTIFNDMLLTLSASDRKLNSLDDDQNVLLRDVAEQRRYPIYGDSSAIEQVATANSNVFFKLEKDKSSLMWGDFTTSQNTTEVNAPRMTTYNRVMTGGKLALNLPKMTNLELFGAASQQTFQRDEIKGAGVSGPYFTAKYPMVNGSERITIETRDRVIVGKIIKTMTLNRLTDYNIDYNNGSITFSQPVASFDENLNPNYIVVNYEYYSNNIVNNSVLGGKITQNIPFVDANIGASYIKENADSPYQLYGVNFSKKFDKAFDFMAEYANSTFEEKSGTTSGALNGNAYRLGLSINPFEELNVLGEYQLVDKSFVNRAGASFMPGSERYSLRGVYKPFSTTDLSFDYNQERNFELNQTNKIFNSKIAQNLFSNIFSVGFEGRVVPDITKPNKDIFAGLINLGYKTPTFYNISLNANRAQNILQTVDRTRPTTTTVGLDYQITSNIKAFGKAGIMEQDNKLIPTTVFGFDTNLTNDLNYLNAMNLGVNYQLDGIVNDKASQTRIGLNNKLTVLPGVMVGGSFESINGANPILNISDDHLAWSTSVDVAPAGLGFRASAKYDGRNGLRESHLLNLNLAGALGEDFGLFGRYTDNYSKDLSRRANTDAVLGMVYRPIDFDFFNALFKYNLRKNTLGIGLLSDTTSNIFSLEGYWQPNFNLEISSFLKLKNGVDKTDGYDPQYSNIPYAELRTQYKLDYNFDLALELRGQYQMENKDLKLSIAPEIGYFPVKDLRVGFGYYVGPSMDLELAGTTFVEQGPYINVALKFDTIGDLWSSQGIVAKKDLVK